MRKLACALAVVLSACGGGGEPSLVEDGREQPSGEAATTYDPVVQSFRGTVGSVQGAQIFYAPQSAGAAVSASFFKQNMLTVVGRNPGFTAGIEQAAAAGGLIAVYLNPVVHPSDSLTDAELGPYQTLLHRTGDGSCGNLPIPQWEEVLGNQYGPGADVRVPHFSGKLACVVRRIKSDYPFIKAIFLDDYGPAWTGYRNVSATTQADAVRCAARNALGAAFEKLRAENLNLLYFVNGGWGAGWCSTGAGYPAAKAHGLAGALPVWEHHAISDGAYSDVVHGPSSQWLKDRTGRVGAMVISSDAAQSDYWKQKPWAAWVAQQATYADAAPRPVVGLSHSIGLSFGDPIGNTEPGAAWSAGQARDWLLSTRVTLTASATVHSLSIYLDGLGGAQSGTQEVRLALYTDLDGRPRRLIAVTRPFKVPAQSRAAWYAAELPTPAYLAAGTYWIAEWTGGTAMISRNNGSWRPGGPRNYYAMSAPYTSTGSPPSTINAYGAASGSLMLTAFMSVQH
jgi:hypothetical protein